MSHPTGKKYISRHVIFNEAEFPFQYGFLNTRKPSHPEIVTAPSIFPWFTNTQLNT